MRLFVAGLGHLGTVVSSCLSKYHHAVAFDDEPAYGLGDDSLLEAAWCGAIKSGNLAVARSLPPEIEADAIIIAYDTPISDGHGRYDLVCNKMARVLANTRKSQLVIVMSQIVPGTIAPAAEMFPWLRFAVVPENIRVGKGVLDFEKMDRLIVGTSDDLSKQQCEEIFGCFVDEIVFTTPATAEVVKLAINSFLSASIAFSNELGEIALRHGAKLYDLERAMKLDRRIGRHAYVSYGGGPGAHLSRDVNHLASKYGGIFQAIKDSHSRFAGVTK